MKASSTFGKFRRIWNIYIKTRKFFSSLKIVLVLIYFKLHEKNNLITSANKTLIQKPQV